MPESVADLARGVRERSRAHIARAITLVESSRPDHRERAGRLLAELAGDTGGSVRVGISGIPGAGKSTFIDALGTRLIEQGHRVAVVAVDPVTDWGNPNVVRGSKATVFSVPVASATLGETIAWLADHGVRHLATTPDTETVHTDVDWSGPVAFSVGTEKYGLTDAALEAADERIRIPMHGVVNSLNVATSAAIVAYEALRHRSRGLSGQDSHPG